MSTLQRLTDRGLIKPPRWLPGNVQYETIMGSVAYGVSSDTSDVDVYGWAIPQKDSPRRSGGCSRRSNHDGSSRCSTSTACC